jgi:hypothetical protein
MDMQGYSQWVLENSGNRNQKPLNNPSFSLQRRFYDHPKSYESAPGPKYNLTKTFENKHAWSINGQRTKERDERDSFVHGHISGSGMLSAVTVRPLSEDPRLVAPGRYHAEEAALKIRPRSTASRFSYSRDPRFPRTDPNSYPGPGAYKTAERTKGHGELWHPSGPNYGPKPRPKKKMAKSRSAAQLTGHKTRSKIQETSNDEDDDKKLVKRQEISEVPEHVPKKRKNIKKPSHFATRDRMSRYDGPKFDKKGIYRGQASPGPTYLVPTDNWKLKNKPPRAVTIANAWR